MSEQSIRILSIEEPQIPIGKFEVAETDKIAASQIGDAPLKLYVYEHSIQKAFAHLVTSKYELAGGLVGQVMYYNAELIVIVEDFLAASVVDHSPSHVRLDLAFWSELGRLKDHHYPESFFLGWAHSHPNLGIFLSGSDLGIHQSLFTQAWNLALVLDAMKENFGFFGWHRSEIAYLPNITIVRSNSTDKSLPTLSHYRFHPQFVSFRSKKSK